MRNYAMSSSTNSHKIVWLFFAMVLAVESSTFGQGVPGELVPRKEKAARELEARKQAAPNLKVVAGDLVFSLREDQTASLKVQVHNTGGQTLKWSAQAPAWLTVSPSNGEIAFQGGPREVAISIRPNALQPGEHSGQLIVIAPGAINSPRTMPLKVRIAAKPVPPRLAVNPVAVELSVFDGEVKTFNIEVENEGGGTLEWTLAALAPFIKHQKIKGRVTAGASESLPFQNRLEKSTVGTHRSSIIISTPSGKPEKVTIPVSLTVKAKTRPKPKPAPPPVVPTPTGPQRAQLAVVPLSVTRTFKSGEPRKGELRIMNAGTAPLEWIIGQPSEHILLSPLQGTTPPGESSAVSYALGQDAPGALKGQFMVSAKDADGAPATVRYDFSAEVKPVPDPVGKLVEEPNLSPPARAFGIFAGYWLPMSGDDEDFDGALMIGGHWRTRIVSHRLHAELTLEGAQLESDNGLEESLLLEGHAQAIFNFTPMLFASAGTGLLFEQTDDSDYGSSSAAGGTLNLGAGALIANRYDLRAGYKVLLGSDNIDGLLSVSLGIRF